MSEFNRNDWRYLSGGRGAVHTSGLVIYAKLGVDDDVYVLNYFNQESWEQKLKSENKQQDDIDIIKLGLCYQFLEIMEEKYKDRATYVIPDRQELRDRIARYKNKYHIDNYER